MYVWFCPNCDRKMGFKRALGFGTLLMSVCTIGFSLLLIPFYPVRCTACGLTASDANRELRRRVKERERREKEEKQLARAEA